MQDENVPWFPVVYNRIYSLLCSYVRRYGTAQTQWCCCLNYIKHVAFELTVWLVVRSLARIKQFYALCFKVITIEHRVWKWPNLCKLPPQFTRSTWMLHSIESQGYQLYSYIIHFTWNTFCLVILFFVSTACTIHYIYITIMLCTSECTNLHHSSFALSIRPITGIISTVCSLIWCWCCTNKVVTNWNSTLTPLN